MKRFYKGGQVYDSDCFCKIKNHYILKDSNNEQEKTKSEASKITKTKNIGVSHFNDNCNFNLVISF